MGFNTSVIVLNDALHEIEEDKEFGKKLAEAVRMSGGRFGRQDIRSGSHANAATVIESHHADHLKILAFGGNTAQEIGFGGNYRATPEEILKTLADQLGFRLVKKPKKKTA